MPSNVIASPLDVRSENAAAFPVFSLDWFCNEPDIEPVSVLQLNDNPLICLSSADVSASFINGDSGHNSSVAVHVDEAEISMIAAVDGTKSAGEFAFLISSVWAGFVFVAGADVVEHALAIKLAAIINEKCNFICLNLRQ